MRANASRARARGARQNLLRATQIDGSEEYRGDLDLRTDFRAGKSVRTSRP